METKKFIITAMPADLHRRLKVLAAEKGISMAALIVNILQAYIAEALK